MNSSRSKSEPCLAPAPALAALVAAETMRNAAPPIALPAAPPRGEERISLFWRVFGGTILSIAALVGITVYQSFAGSLTDLRSSISHVNEVQANLATKDDLNTKATALWTASKDVTAQAADLKTRTALLETQLRSAEEERKALNQEIGSLRERLRTLEYRMGDAAPKKKADAE